MGGELHLPTTSRGGGGGCQVLLHALEKPRDECWVGEARDQCRVGEARGSCLLQDSLQGGNRCDHQQLFCTILNGIHPNASKTVYKSGIRIVPFVNHTPRLKAREQWGSGATNTL